MKKFRSDSRIYRREAAYFGESEIDCIYDEHDRQEVLKLRVGEYYLSEYARYTRVE
jgi:hypothetical protein